MNPICRQLTPVDPTATKEKPMHAPTMLCVPETGKPNIVAMSCQIADPAK